MYGKVLENLKAGLDEIEKDQQEILKQREDAIYYIKNSRSWNQLKLAIEMMVIVGKRYMLLRDRITFVQKTQKEIGKRLKRAGV